MQKYYRWLNLPNLDKLSASFSQPLLQSKNFLGRFRNIAPKHLNLQLGIKIRVANNAHLFLRLRAKHLLNVFANDGKPLLPEYKYRLPDCNDCLIIRVLVLALNHDNSGFFCNVNELPSSSHLLLNWLLYKK